MKQPISFELQGRLWLDGQGSACSPFSRYFLSTQKKGLKDCPEGGGDSRNASTCKKMDYPKMTQSSKSNAPKY